MNSVKPANTPVRTTAMPYERPISKAAAAFFPVLVAAAGAVVVASAKPLKTLALVLAEPPAPVWLAVDEVDVTLTRLGSWAPHGWSCWQTDWQDESLPQAAMQFCTHCVHSK